MRFVAETEATMRDEITSCPAAYQTRILTPRATSLRRGRRSLWRMHSRQRRNQTGQYHEDGGQEQVGEGRVSPQEMPPDPRRGNDRPHWRPLRFSCFHDFPCPERPQPYVGRILAARNPVAYVIFGRAPIRSMPVRRSLDITLINRVSAPTATKIPPTLPSPTLGGGPGWGSLSLGN